MKRLRICRTCLHAALARIHLVDRCLILFMLVLLLQSAYSIFFHTGVAEGTDTIDIIVRTSSAAIFGYFLSANFIRHPLPGPIAPDAASLSAPPRETAPGGTVSKDAPHGQIGFSLAEQPREPERGGTAGPPPEPAAAEDGSCSRLQIIVATCIGLFCLVTLLLTRNVSAWNASLSESPSSAATVAQFRDFVSGCVGFLIGCPTHHSGEPAQ